jgi:serine/alanine racemase
MKFFCSILVVMIHFAPFGVQEDLTVFNCLNHFLQGYLTRIAVPFFFVCTGFFLYQDVDFDNFSFKQTKKYVVRLFRMYIIWSIIWSIIYLPLSIKGLIGDEKGIFHAILSYIRDFIFKGSYKHLWYLNATIFAVLLISFLMYRKVSIRRIIVGAFVLYVIGLFDQSWYGIIKPLRELMPSIWLVLHIAKKIIVTTRDGLFEGFLFISIGMLFANNKINISKRQSIKGFIISMILMFAEFMILDYFNLAREYDTYLFLVPSTIFGFAVISQIRLSDSKIYKKLRTLSSLIFYLHMWVGTIISNTNIRIFGKSFWETSACFVVTLCITVMVSLVVMSLSEARGLEWSKKLYS